MAVRKFALLTILTVGLASACRAESRSPFAQPEEHPVTATLIAEHASIQPGGATHIGVLFEMQEGWHIYAQDPGDAGLPTTVTWSVSAPKRADFEDTVFGPLQYPAPKEFLDPGDIRTFGYSGTVVLSSTVLVIAKIVPSYDRLAIVADVQWLACKDICIPGRADLELTLPLSFDPPALSTHAHLFASLEP